MGRLSDRAGPLQLAAAIALALWAALLAGAAARWADGLGGVASPAGFALLGFAAALAPLVVALWLGASEAAVLTALGVAVASGLLLLGAPHALVAKAVAMLAGRLFDGPVPPAVVRFVAVFHAWGLAQMAAMLVLVSIAPRLPRLDGKARFGWAMVAVLALYAGLTAWTANAQSLTGDEPHYLLATQQLVQHGDLDLADAYRAQRWREFYPSDLMRRSLLGLPAELDPHAVPGRDGARRSVHQSALSVLLAPGYLVAGRAGAQATAVLIALLTAWVALTLLIGLCADGDETWFAFAALVLCSPLLAECGALHVDALGAAGLGWLACLATAARPSRRAYFGGFVAAAVLPLCSLKWLPAESLLILAIALDGRRRGERLWWLPGAGLVLGLGGQLAQYWLWFGSASPSAPRKASGGFYPGLFSGDPRVGLPGTLLDQQAGLLAAWPVALLAAPGLGLLARHRRGRVLLLPMAAQWLVVAVYRDWSGGFTPGGRELLPVAVLLAPALAVGYGWVRLRRPWLPRLLLAVNGALVLLAAWAPRLRYPRPGADGLDHQPLLGLAHQPLLDVIFPLVARRGAALGVAWLELLALAALAVWTWRRQDPPHPS
jgi:hypothetical protein